MLKAVILNDTRGHHHFGCHKVMETIENKLAARGVTITALSLVRHDWENDDAFLTKLKDCDLIIINGEGTLHHGSRHGEKLLRIAHHPARGNKPLALINALFQDNPSEWKTHLDGFDFLATRDKRSAHELEAMTGKQVHNTLDLSLSVPIAGNAGDDRPDKVIGESVDREATRMFLDIAKAHPDFVFLPIVRTLKSSKPQYRGFAYQFRELVVFAHAAMIKAQLRNDLFCRDYHEYGNALSKASSHITGRYHAVCFSLLTMTPFLALSSNSWKIEALLEDIGMTQDRIVDRSALSGKTPSIVAPAFSQEEHSLISKALKNCATDTDRIFDEMVKLA